MAKMRCRYRRPLLPSLYRSLRWSLHSELPAAETDVLYGCMIYAVSLPPATIRSLAFVIRFQCTAINIKCELNLDSRMGSIIITVAPRISCRMVGRNCLILFCWSTLSKLIKWGPFSKNLHTAHTFLNCWVFERLIFVKVARNDRQVNAHQTICDLVKWGTVSPFHTRKLCSS